MEHAPERETTTAAPPARPVATPVPVPQDMRAQVLALQRAAGNSAVVKLLRRATRRGVHESDASITEAEIEGGTAFVQGEGDAHEVDYSDVVQGQLNDCFVLAPLISIARFKPNWIKNLIEVATGGWNVTLYTKGWFWWYNAEKVFVNNKFWQRGGRPIYAKTGDTKEGKVELWPMIIEKAVAIKKGGSYQNLDFGMTSEVMSMLTGKDCTWRHTPDRSDDDLLDDFVKAQNDGRGVACNTKVSFAAGAEQTKAQSLGVINQHSYGFIGVNKSAKTVSLRDPNNVAHLPNLSITDLKLMFDWVCFSDGYK